MVMSFFEILKFSDFKFSIVYKGVVDIFWNSPIVNLWMALVLKETWYLNIIEILLTKDKFTWQKREASMESSAVLGHRCPILVPFSTESAFNMHGN